MNKILALACPLLLATIILLMAAPVMCSGPWDMPEQSGFGIEWVLPGTGGDRNGDGVVWEKIVVRRQGLKFIIEIDNRELKKPPETPL